MIQNQGISQTIIHNNHKDMYQMNWDANYDGNHANISVNLLDKNKLRHYEVVLDNADLENLFSIPSVNSPLHKRLMNDFSHKSKKNHPKDTRIASAKSRTHKSYKHYTHLSSPKKNDRLMILPRKSTSRKKEKIFHVKSKHYTI